MEVLGFSERVGGFLFDRSVAGVDSLRYPRLCDSSASLDCFLLSCFRVFQFSLDIPAHETSETADKRGEEHSSSAMSGKLSVPSMGEMV